MHNPTEVEVRDASTERVQDVDTVFSIEPEAGILAPGMTASFVLSFAPSQVNELYFQWESELPQCIKDRTCYGSYTVNLKNLNSNQSLHSCNDMCL